MASAGRWQSGRAGRGADRIASGLVAGNGQLARAWLLRRSPVLLPIPVTSSVEHLRDNVSAAALNLTDEDFAALEAAAN